MVRLVVNYGGGINLENNDTYPIETLIIYYYLFSNEIKNKFSNDVYIKFIGNFSYIYDIFGYFFNIKGPNAFLDIY